MDRNSIIEGTFLSTLMEWVIIGMSFSYDGTFSQMSNSLKVCAEIWIPRQKSALTAPSRRDAPLLGLVPLCDPQEKMHLIKGITSYATCPVMYALITFSLLNLDYCTKESCGSDAKIIQIHSTWKQEHFDTKTRCSCVLINPMVMARFPAEQSIQFLVSRKCCETSLVVCPLELWGRVSSGVGFLSITHLLEFSPFLLKPVHQSISLHTLGGTRGQLCQQSSYWFFFETKRKAAKNSQFLLAKLSCSSNEDSQALRNCSRGHESLWLYWSVQSYKHIVFSIHSNSCIGCFKSWLLIALRVLWECAAMQKYPSAGLKSQSLWWWPSSSPTPSLLPGWKGQHFNIHLPQSEWLSSSTSLTWCLAVYLSYNILY